MDDEIRLLALARTLGAGPTARGIGEPVMRAELAPGRLIPMHAHLLHVLGQPPDPSGDGPWPSARCGSVKVKSRTSLSVLLSSEWAMPVRAVSVTPSPSERR